MYTDLLIRLKNAQTAGRPVVKAPYSKFDKAVTDLLVKYNFVKKAEVKGRGIKKIIKITLNPARPIREVKLLSKPSIKKYAGYKEIRLPKNGRGLVALSTPQGILDGQAAKQNKVGGLLLFEVW